MGYSTTRASAPGNLRTGPRPDRLLPYIGELYIGGLLTLGAAAPGNLRTGPRPDRLLPYRGGAGFLGPHIFLNFLKFLQIFTNFH